MYTPGAYCIAGRLPSIATSAASRRLYITSLFPSKFLPYAHSVYTAEEQFYCQQDEIVTDMRGAITPH